MYETLELTLMRGYELSEYSRDLAASEIQIGRSLSEPNQESHKVVAGTEANVEYSVDLKSSPHLSKMETNL